MLKAVVIPVVVKVTDSEHDAVAPKPITSTTVAFEQAVPPDNAVVLFARATLPVEPDIFIVVTVTFGVGNAVPVAPVARAIKK